MRKPRREAPYHDTEADRRYGELLDQVSNSLGDDQWRLIQALDEVVGKRLCEAEDRMAPKCTRGRYR